MHRKFSLCINQLPLGPQKLSHHLGGDLHNPGDLHNQCIQLKVRDLHNHCVQLEARTFIIPGTFIIIAVCLIRSILIVYPFLEIEYCLSSRKQNNFILEFSWKQTFFKLSFSLTFHLMKSYSISQKQNDSKHKCTLFPSGL